MAEDVFEVNVTSNTGSGNGGDGEKKPIDPIQPGMYPAKLKAVIKKDVLKRKGFNGEAQSGFEFQFEFVDLYGQQWPWDYIKAEVAHNFAKKELNIKSNLYKYLVALNGGEIPEGKLNLVMADYVGKYCELEITNNAKKDDPTIVFTNVKGIKAMPSGKIAQYQQSKGTNASAPAVSTSAPKEEVKTPPPAQQATPAKQEETIDDKFEF
jgi:hypothetical protein